MLLSDPEMESSILISSDEGATYQKYRLTFYIQSLLFHPRQEDWVLAYSLDQKVNKYCFLFTSCHPGTTWWKALVYLVWILEGIQQCFIIPTGFVLFAATNFPFCSLVQNMQAGVFHFWQYCLSFHRLKMVSSVSLLIWPLKPPCEISRKCVFIVVL